jgi:hypothetical protein
MYSLIIVAFIIIFIIEKRDWDCLNAYQLYEKCKVGEGMCYRGSTPHNADDCEVLLNKIDKAAGAEKKSIKWRRAFILSVIIVFAIFTLLVTKASLPDWTTFYLAVIISTFTLYFSFNNYSYHKYSVPTNNIKRATNLIRERCLKTKL